jgi:hypothetical protein
MNEIGSLFLATIVLAIGGMGLYYYKSFELNENEELLEEEIPDEEEENYDEPEIVEYKPRASPKSKKNKRKIVGTKKRYYY